MNGVTVVAYFLCLFRNICKSYPCLDWLVNLWLLLSFLRLDSGIETLLWDDNW